MKSKKRLVWKSILIILIAAGVLMLYRAYLWPGREGPHRQVLTGRVCMYHRGFTDRSFTGIVSLPSGSWYLRNGRADIAYTGLVKLPEGWYYVVSGKVDASLDGFYEDGVFCWYLQNGEVRFDQTGFRYGRVGERDGWWYVKDGRVFFADDLIKAEHHWWYTDRGRVQFGYRGTAANRAGEWYLMNGKVDFSYSGFSVMQDGIYFIAKGQVLGQVRSDSTHFVAHRGLSDLAPENTLRAFTLAGEAGFWGCETDIHRTADGRFVILHDDDFERMCGVRQKPEDLTSDEIRNLRIISGRHLEDYTGDESALRVPFLEEYLDVCFMYEMVPVIELKSFPSGDEESDRELLVHLCQIVQDRMQDRKVIFISFDYSSLKLLREILHTEGRTDYELQYLAEAESTQVTARCQELNMDLDVKYDAIGENTIAAWHEKGRQVNAWTVNHPEDVYDLVQKGIDFITTNKRFWKNGNPLKGM